MKKILKPRTPVAKWDHHPPDPDCAEKKYNEMTKKSKFTTSNNWFRNLAMFQNTQFSIEIPIEEISYRSNGGGCCLTGWRLPVVYYAVNAEVTHIIGAHNFWDNVSIIDRFFLQFQCRWISINFSQFTLMGSQRKVFLKWNELRNNVVKANR